MSNHEIEKDIFRAMPVPDNSSQSTTQPTFIQLRCTNCGGTMQTEKNNKILCCPYCQSKTMVLNESPLEAYKEVEIERARSYERLALGREKMKHDSNTKEIIALVVFAIVCIIGILIILSTM